MSQKISDKFTKIQKDLQNLCFKRFRKHVSINIGWQRSERTHQELHVAVRVDAVGQLMPREAGGCLYRGPGPSAEADPKVRASG